MMTMSNAGLGLIRASCVVLLVLGVQSARSADTNSQTVRTDQQIQEQILSAQYAAASNSMLLEGRLRTMEKAFDNERREQLTAAEHSNRMILVAAGAVAAIGFLALVFAAFLQWAAVNRLAAAAATLSATHSSPVLGMGPAQLLPPQALEKSNAGFLSLIERLEGRVRELESSLHAPESLPETGQGNGESNRPAAEDKASTIGLLLSKSQTLVKLDKPEEALECLDGALAQDPANAQALVKKGAVLERLHRFDEALECYDRAIAQDNSMTMAYLCKGGVFNRLERYTEALACYEQALKKSDKKGA